MFRTFDCPKCGAPVRYERNEMLGAQQATVRCDSCHSSLMAPDELHGQPARVVPVTIDLRNLSSRKVTKWIWVLVAIPLFLPIADWHLDTLTEVPVHNPHRIDNKSAIGNWKSAIH